MQFPTLYVIDSSSAVAAATALAPSLGIPQRLFDSAQAFLRCYSPELTGCILADLRSRQLGGVTLLRALAERGSVLPVVFVTAISDVSTTVEVMKRGALTVMEAPWVSGEFVRAVREGFQRNAQARAALAQRADAQRRMESLTADERRVIAMILDGHPNKVIAREFGSCRRTAERMRAKVFEKLGVTAAVQLPAVVYRAEKEHLGAETICRPAFERSRSDRLSCAETE